MVIHKDSIDETVLNQISSAFQTVINIRENKPGFNALSKKSQNFNYDLQLIHKNTKSSKVKFFVKKISFFI